MSRRAWAVRGQARVHGKTLVGCAVLSEAGEVFVGCNIEHRFRSHDIHAEVAALSGLVSAGGTTVAAVLIAAERENFTPCGACLDWIMELGGPDCWVVCEKTQGGLEATYTASELMPHYPY